MANVNKPKKVSLEATYPEIYVKLCDLVDHMLAMFNIVKSSVCVVDLAENYYAGSDSVTVHQMVLIFTEDSSVRRDSVTTMSDDSKHDDAYAVYMFMGALEVHVGKYYHRIIPALTK